MTIVHAGPPKRSPPRKKRTVAKPGSVIVTSRKDNAVQMADGETNEGVKAFFRRMVLPLGRGADEEGAKHKPEPKNATGDKSGRRPS